jgi:hypothetical protein
MALVWSVRVLRPVLAGLAPHCWRQLAIPNTSRSGRGVITPGECVIRPRGHAPCHHCVRSLPRARWPSWVCSRLPAVLSRPAGLSSDPGTDPWPLLTGTVRMLPGVPDPSCSCHPFHPVLVPDPGPPDCVPRARPGTGTICWEQDGRHGAVTQSLSSRTAFLRTEADRQRAYLATVGPEEGARLDDVGGCCPRGCLCRQARCSTVVVVPDSSPPGTRSSRCS